VEPVSETSRELMSDSGYCLTIGVPVIVVQFVSFTREKTEETVEREREREREKIKVEE